MRLVLDTSVIVAAVRSVSGASNLLLKMAFDDEFDMLLSVSLLLEYEAVLMRPEQLEASSFSHVEMNRILDTIRDHATDVHLGFFWPLSARDRDDSHVLTLASVGRADGLVTHNIRDFAGEASGAGVNLYTPAEALRRLRS